MNLRDIDLLHKIIRWEYRKDLLQNKLVPNADKIKRVEDVTLDKFAEYHLESFVNKMNDTIENGLKDLVTFIESKRKQGLSQEDIPDDDTVWTPDEFTESEAKQRYRNQIIKMAKK